MNGFTDRFVRKKVAVIGSGSAGIGALWALNKTYHDVYLYEAGDRLGGHANTVQFKNGKYTTCVDTGFNVVNEATCPNFLKFLDKIGVKTEPTEVTFSVSRDRGAFEWANVGLRSLFSQRRNILSLRMWRLVFDIMRFNQFALDLLFTDEASYSDLDAVNGISKRPQTEETIGEYLDRNGYSEAFRDDYLIPVAAAVWCTSPDESILEFPAAALVRLLWSHHLLSDSTTRSQWLTLKEGSKSYVDAVIKGFPPNHLFLKTPVRHVSTEDDGQVRVHLENGTSALYDHVILATHGDVAFDIIRPWATEQEKSIMSCFKTSQNEVVLHSDASLMPQRRKAWASWNAITLSSRSPRKARVDQACLTYNMNILQHIPREIFGDVLITLNPLHKPKPELTQGRYYYSLPLYTTSAIGAQKLLKHVQNTRGISYAGAWTNHGLHEDGFTSGLQVAQEHLGAKLPFQLTNPSTNRGGKPSLGLIDHLMRLLILVLQVFVVQLMEWLFGNGSFRRQRVVNGYHGKIANGKHN